MKTALIIITAAALLSACGNDETKSVSAPRPDDDFALAVYAAPDDSASLAAVEALVKAPRPDSADVKGRVFNIIRQVIRQGNAADPAPWHYLNAYIEGEFKGNYESAYWCLERARAAAPRGARADSISAYRRRVELARKKL